MEVEEREATAVDHALDALSKALDRLVELVEDGGLDVLEDLAPVGFLQRFEQVRHRTALVDHWAVREVEARRLPERLTQPSVAVAWRGRSGRVRRHRSRSTSWPLVDGGASPATPRSCPPTRSSAWPTRPTSTPPWSPRPGWCCSSAGPDVSPPAGRPVALIARDGGCSFPGCDRPPEWCGRHHVIAWTDGGPTDLANVTSLCACHHHFASRGWTCQMTDRLPAWTPPRWIDADQRPLRNTRLTARHLDRLRC